MRELHIEIDQGKVDLEKLRFSRKGKVKNIRLDTNPTEGESKHPINIDFDEDWRMGIEIEGGKGEKKEKVRYFYFETGRLTDLLNEKRIKKKILLFL
jgi:hypothetical protein